MASEPEGFEDPERIYTQVTRNQIAEGRVVVKTLPSMVVTKRASVDRSVT